MDRQAADLRHRIKAAVWVRDPRLKQIKRSEELASILQNAGLAPNSGAFCAQSAQNCGMIVGASRI
ncbi:MAG TPA: hypothetical protein VGI93_03905 [Steroidobacteraceae bacterium]